MCNGIHALHSLLEPLARDDVLDFDKLELVGVVRVPVDEVLRLGPRANRSANAPARGEESVDDLPGLPISVQAVLRALAAVRT